MWIPSICVVLTHRILSCLSVWWPGGINDGCAGERQASLCSSVRGKRSEHSRIPDVPSFRETVQLAVWLHSGLLVPPEKTAGANGRSGLTKQIIVLTWWDFIFQAFHKRPNANPCCCTRTHPIWGKRGYHERGLIIYILDTTDRTNGLRFLYLPGLNCVIWNHGGRVSAVLLWTSGSTQGSDLEKSNEGQFTSQRCLSLNTIVNKLHTHMQTFVSLSFSLWINCC